MSFAEKRLYDRNGNESSTESNDEENFVDFSCSIESRMKMRIHFLSPFVRLRHDGMCQFDFVKCFDREKRHNIDINPHLNSLSSPSNQSEKGGRIFFFTLLLALLSCLAFCLAFNFFPFAFRELLKNIFLSNVHEQNAESKYVHKFPTNYLEIGIGLALFYFISLPKGRSYYEICQILEMERMSLPQSNTNRYFEALSNQSN
ncbi:CLUMA_CG014706, isoform A [Clunio marinus]|uniref:CLUMA_CG014706, isoform A n=1 Tax=Clunio marinus TaxID=568069 RepID=A0A1J1ILN0_9DIPT|nr:CLUMA_CG014706, isoform A [Clunio marinus]